MDKIMVVEDEASIRDFIVLSLKHAGYEVLTSESGELALQLFSQNPDIKIILLDVMLPGIDGFEVCRRLRVASDSIGIILLTAKIQESDKVQGLGLGADDYITKPFSPAEMIARLKALRRRLGLQGKKDQAETIVSSIFRLCEDNEQFFRNGQLIELTPTEFQLVKVLMQHADQLLSRDELLDKVWGKNFVGDAKIVDVNVRRLRQKIEDDPSNPRYIVTHWGRGYFWHGDKR
ncbi:response regulator transcription factor [Sporolactobacillus shoreicorticis]|uniref:Response regulator transcription factor n=1 Tax=Sporolactobacillus shoreicorticis TaxID=1923877 RepID=A0ABW5S0G0_9BACL|nr:response regulator transcription factor [Sporolactobacillus shoreicorticis]MCO7124551.1 response regulator transcription factor [Sporolactobacillus shoreicorticis]